MDDIASEIGKGLLRAIGSIFIDLIFNFIFYYIGWPICKIVSLGSYPKKTPQDLLHTSTRQGLACSFVGMLVVVIIGLYFCGQFDFGNKP